MARLVLHKAKKPAQVGDKWVCQCGLSKNKPYCDSSHHKTTDEEEGKVYRYENGNRVEVD